MSPASPCSTVCDIEGGRSWLGWSQWNSKLPCALSQTLSFHVVSGRLFVKQTSWGLPVMLTSRMLLHCSFANQACWFMFSCDIIICESMWRKALDLQQWQSGIMTAPPLRQGCHINPYHTRTYHLQLTRVRSEVTAPNDAEPASASLLDGVYLARNLETLATHNLQWYHEQSRTFSKVSRSLRIHN